MVYRLLQRVTVCLDSRITERSTRTTESSPLLRHPSTRVTFRFFSPSFYFKYVPGLCKSLSPSDESLSRPTLRLPVLCSSHSKYNTILRHSRPLGRKGGKKEGGTRERWRERNRPQPLFSVSKPVFPPIKRSPTYFSRPNLLPHFIVW